jgi:epoxyqueuosine reductase
VYGNFARRLRDRALALGFDHVGTCGLDPTPRDADAYRHWVASEMAGEMAYMARPDRIARALDPRAGLPGARGLVVVAVGYHDPGASGPDGRDPDRDGPPRGLISAYARGRDYHDVMLPRLAALGEWLTDAVGRPVAGRAMVDFGPLLERDAAARAGLGFIGKNAMLIHPRAGSWSFLGALLVDVDLDLASAPAAGLPGCGRCTRCLDACPTGAFAGPYVLDARRCISYLTIELKGPIPREFRPALGNRILGCDVCNDVCPYNRRFAHPAREPAFRARGDRMAPRLDELLDLDESGFTVRYGGTGVARTRRRGLLRNACVALGNAGDPAAVPALTGALRDGEALVRGHAAWALGRIGTRCARDGLSAARAREADPWAREEIDRALDGY